MIELAGGVDALGEAGEPSFRVEWEEVTRSRADIIVLMPCGYDLAQTLAEFEKMRLPAAWENIPAVCTGRVVAVDASGYCSRPGPRTVTGIEILADILHPWRVDILLPEQSVGRLAQPGTP
jgi:iron complex transport system substrate-binding protein